MEWTIDEAMPVLARTPATLRTMLDGLPEAWLTATEGPDTWSPRDVIGHLVHGEETDWIPRARIILEHGPARTFDPFDRFAQFERFHGRSTAELLELFAERRRESLEALAALDPSGERLARRGTHPALGAVTLGQLLATWVAHDLDHVAQIARVMARRYETTVGPWKAYLGILNWRS